MQWIMLHGAALVASLAMFLSGLVGVLHLIGSAKANALAAKIQSLESSLAQIGGQQPPAPPA